MGLIACSPPIPQHGPGQRQRGHGGRIGAQDAGPQGEAHDVGKLEQRRALIVGEAALRPDQDRQGRPSG